MSSYRRALRQERARRFGRRHPRLALAIVILAMGGVLALCVAQIDHGTYLGRSWLIAAVAGIAAGAGLSPVALIRSRRTPWGRLQLVWVLVTVLSASSIRLPFPVGHYGRPQAVVNVVHAALLGYMTLTITAIVVVMVGVLARFVRANGWRALPYTPEPPLPRGPRRFRGWPAWVLAGACAGLVGCVILAGIGGSNLHDAPSRASGALGAVSLVMICVAGPAALYRWYRSRRVGPAPPSPRHNATAASPAGPDYGRQGGKS